MKGIVAHALVAGMICGGLVALRGRDPVNANDDDQVVLQADRALLQSIAGGNKPAVGKLLGADFTWINSQGISRTREQVLDNLPTPANADVEIQERTYGRAAIVRANRGKVQVMRIWAKRPGGWQAILYQEVALSGPTQPLVAPAKQVASECENPCKTIPFKPETNSEKEAIASWQGVMRAMAGNDAAAYAPLIADEFSATDTHHDTAFYKADRIAQINKQKQSGERSSPPPLVSARMFDFGETVMMIAREQRPNAKPYFNTRMWVQRDGRWQMLFSFNTRID